MSKESRGILGLFKRGSEKHASTSTAHSDDATAAEPEDRRKLISSLSSAEKAKRRSTIGPAGSVTIGQTPAVVTPIQPLPPPKDVDTQYSKLFKRTSQANMPREIYRDAAVKPFQEAPAASKNVKRELSKEEKKLKRKSLLSAMAPIGPAPTPSAGPNTSTPSLLTSPRSSMAGLGTGTAGFSMLGEAGDSIASQRSPSSERRVQSGSASKLTTSVQSPSDKQLQKQKLKQLQKQMERDAKKQEKTEKAKHEKAVEILQAQLELGRERATMPEPAARFVAMSPSRPARMTTTIS